MPDLPGGTVSLLFTEESGLAWTIIRGPLTFTDGTHTHRYHAGPIGQDRRPAISRADLADFMLRTSTTAPSST